MNWIKTIAMAATASFLALGAPMPGQAADIKPALLYAGSKFDGSFSENAFFGAERFKKETGVSFFEFEPRNEVQREQALRTFAQQGADPIVTIGFDWALSLEKMAPQYPNSRFVIVDGKVDLPNVQSIEFAYNEGAFVVGALAGLKTKTGTIGFVGGMDIPLIRSFACGYEAGARYTNPQITVLQNMTGTTPAAWSDPARGRELALGQYDRGADIVFAAAGGTAMGVLQAAADADKLAIGAGPNQNGVHPGHVLTSATDGVDAAVYRALSDALGGKWKPGLLRLGVRDGGLGWSLDDNNRPLLTEKDIATVEAIKADIASGKITVHEYIETNSCPGK